jgi:hypothetical protein
MEAPTRRTAYAARLRLALLCGVLLLPCCARSRRDNNEVRPDLVGDIRTQEQLAKEIRGCIALNSKSVSAVELRQAEDGKITIHRTCFAEGHDQVCIRRVLGRLRVRSVDGGGFFALLIYVVPDAGVAVTNVHDALKALGFVPVGGTRSTPSDEDCVGITDAPIPTFF